MNKFIPIRLESDLIEIHPLGEREFREMVRVVNDLYEILGDAETMKFIPEKLVKDRQEIELRLIGFVSNYEKEEGFTHFLSHKKYNKIIGGINIIPPKKIKIAYNISDEWFIEYYLNKTLWGKGIISGVLNAIVKNMQNQGINKISALCHPDNIASIHILNKIGFKDIETMILGQKYYRLIK
ncbi:GNAT family N-acetyltransferase [Shiella aurantiaca]|nr:GNAT family protein [Shiella aurantiaca]